MDALSQLKDELSKALCDLDALQTQFRFPGRADSWTIQQIAEHLRLSYVSTRGVMEARLARGGPTKTPVTLKDRVAQFTVTQCGYFPSGRKAPAIVTPGELEPLSGNAVFARVAADVDAMAAAIDEVERTMGKGRVANHAVLGPLSASQWRRFHLLHARHHIRQISRLRSSSA